MKLAITKEIQETNERVELHCHSKAGGNATMYAGELLRYASMKNIPAIAITDRSNILAFAEIDSVCKCGDYTTRPIFGMEMLIRYTQGGDVYTLSILIRNETGKENLYRLITETADSSPYPVFEWDNLKKYREGLLLGSGAENGKLRLCARDGDDDEELRRIIEGLDYVEVLPYGCDRRINEKLIRIAEEADVPVVAVSDAHFLEAQDKKAWSVLNNTMDIPTNCHGVHLFSTEEMMSAFSYLPEKETRKIVLQNPMSIADMCESIRISPEKKMYPVIPDSKNRLRELCEEALKVKYNDARREEAKLYMDTELQGLENTGMEFALLQTKELMDMAGLRACDISLRGTGGGGMIVYLLGIGEVDPLKFRLVPERIFGLKNDKEIDIDINVPREMVYSIHKLMGKLEGVGMALDLGCTETIPYYAAEEIVDIYGQRSLTEEEREVICGKIVGNYTGKKRHPGGVLLYPEGCDPLKLMPVQKLPGFGEVGYFDHFYFDKVYKTDVLGHGLLDALRSLSERCGVDLVDVPNQSDEVMTLFAPDANGEVTGCVDLPEFRSDDTQKMVALLKPQSFDDLVKISALSHGTGVWEENGKDLIVKHGLGLNDIIGSRDDVYDHLRAWGMDRVRAYEFSEMVRKGQGASKRPVWVKRKGELVEAGIPEWYIESCEKIRYLFPRAHCISYMFMTLRLAWFKLHFPNEFASVMAEYEI